MKKHYFEKFNMLFHASDGFAKIQCSFDMGYAQVKQAISVNSLPYI